MTRRPLSSGVSDGTTNKNFPFVYVARWEQKRMPRRTVYYGLSFIMNPRIPNIMAIPEFRNTYSCSRKTAKDECVWIMHLCYPKRSNFTSPGNKLWIVCVTPNRELTHMYEKQLKNNSKKQQKYAKMSTSVFNVKVRVLWPYWLILWNHSRRAWIQT